MKLKRQEGFRTAENKEGEGGELELVYSSKNVELVRK